MTPGIRSLLTGALAVLTAVGVLPDDAREAIEANAEPILSGVLALWSLTAYLRHRKERGA